jgi:CFEM domain
MAPSIMKLLAILSFTTSLVLSTSTTSSSSMVMSAAMSTSVDNSPEYSITALPAVQSAPSCLFNCLIPIGLADSSGCDDVTENCACLSAPADVLDFLTDCVETVCQSSTSAFIASATSLYESYCVSVYGSSSFSAAFVMESEMASLAAASSKWDHFLLSYCWLLN